MLKDVTQKVRSKKNIDMFSSSTSSTEEFMQADGMDPDIEACVRDEVKIWLATHGSKLFALEASKFNAAEAKRKNIRGHR